VSEITLTHSQIFQTAGKENFLYSINRQHSQGGAWNSFLFCFWKKKRNPRFLSLGSPFWTCPGPQKKIQRFLTENCSQLEEGSWERRIFCPNPILAFLNFRFLRGFSKGNFWPGHVLDRVFKGGQSKDTPS